MRVAGIIEEDDVYIIELFISTQFSRNLCSYSIFRSGYETMMKAESGVEDIK